MYVFYMDSAYMHMYVGVYMIIIYNVTDCLLW